MIAPFDHDEDGKVDSQFYTQSREFYGAMKDDTTRVPIIVLDFNNSTSLKNIGSQAFNGCSAVPE
jgi:hypothetical protein